AKMVLIGHSIGVPDDPGAASSPSPRHRQGGRCLLLFPTIERMRESPQGRIVAPLLSLAPLRWLAMALVALLSLLIPLAWRRGFAARCLSAVGHSNANRAPVLGNVLYMAHTEMQDVPQPDLATIRQHSQRILLYYGADDHWCPTEYFADMRRSCPGLDEGDVAHAFVLEHSVEMADLCAGWYCFGRKVNIEQ
uniref:Lipid droplet-associated hydrolase n=1 Tax=Macrostomum lignano TaxID=282301 RepID=A0A1I8FI81_9PLAT